MIGKFERGNIIGNYKMSVSDDTDEQIMPNNSEQNQFDNTVSTVIGNKNVGGVIGIVSKNTSITDFKSKVGNVDGIELDVDSKSWPVPSYGDLLYSVK